MRRLHKWAKKVGVDFTLDPAMLIPDEATLKAKPIEDTPRGGSSYSADKTSEKSVGKTFEFLIKPVK
jgi:hypothetical protein